MLRRKLSKLLLGVVMSSFVLGFASKGQASFATTTGTQAGAQAPQIGTGVVDGFIKIDANNKANLETILADDTLKQLEISVPVELTEQIAVGLGQKRQLQIVFSATGRFDVNTITVQGTKRMNLSISDLHFKRAADKKDEMFRIIGETSLGISDSVFENMSEKTTEKLPIVSIEQTALTGTANVLNFMSNKVNGGVLFKDFSSAMKAKVTLSQNSFDNSSLSSATVQESSLEATKITDSGFDLTFKIVEGANKDLAQLNGQIDFTLGDGQQISKEVVDGTVTHSFTGLTPNTSYTIKAQEVVLYDKNVVAKGTANKYVVRLPELIVTTSVKGVADISVADIDVTSSAAYVNIAHGNLNPRLYPLTIELSEVGSNAKPQEILIKDSTVQGNLFDKLKPNSNYMVRLLDVNRVPITAEKTFRTKVLGNFDVRVSNITSNSAVFVIDHGNINTQDYDLTLRLSNGKEIKGINANHLRLSVDALVPNTKYDFEFFDKNGKRIYVGQFTTLDVNGSTSNGVISGGSGSSKPESSNLSGTITSSDINKSTIKDITADIYVGNSNLSNSLKDGKDFKTNIEGVTASFVDGKIKLEGLVPEKEYNNLIVSYVDKNGKARNVKVSNFKTAKAETKLLQFVKDVYYYSLNRLPDEVGYAYWTSQIKNKKITPSEFVRNLVNEKEFINRYSTTEGMIDALYSVIVNRKSDSEGLRFWTKKYDELIKNGYGTSTSMVIIVDAMVNENEFKERVAQLGL